MLCLLIVKGVQAKLEYLTTKTHLGQGKVQVNSW